MATTAGTARTSEWSRWTRPIVVLTVLALGCLGLALAWHSTSDLDLPLHDRAGRDILAGGGIPRSNQYSFTAPDHPWVDHEWGFQIAVAAAGRVAGGDDLASRARGWQALRLLLAALLVGALAAELGRLPGSSRVVLALAGPVGLAGLAMLWTRLTLRPELVSFLLFVLVLRRAESALREAGDRSPWRSLADPRRPGGQALLLTIVWHQVHGFAALAGLVWLLAGLLGRSPRPASGRWRLALGGAAFAVAASLLTPNLLAGSLYPLRALGQFGRPGVDLRETISELVPLLETRGSLSTTLQIFKASLVWGALWTVATWGRTSRVRAAIWALAAVAAWQGQRNLGFYAVCFVLLHGDPGPGLPRLWTWLGEAVRARAGARIRRIAGVAVPVALAAGTFLVAAAWFAALTTDAFYLREGEARRWGGGLTPATFPESAVASLPAGPPPRVANNVDAASTLVGAGTARVAIDGRTEAYPPSTWTEYARLKAGGADATRQLRVWRAQAVCLAHRNAASHALIRTLLADPAWTLAAADEAGILFLPAATRPDGDADSVLVRATTRYRERLATAPAGRDVRLADLGASLATLLQLADRGPAAEAVLVAALARCADHPTLHHNLGNRLLERGELGEALGHFERAARLNRNAAPPLVNAGRCLFDLGRIAEAAGAFERAVDRDPRNFEGWANLAEARRQLGDRAAAAAAYGRALRLRPDDQRLRARAASL
ncbi:MAG TPA: tetratricopeptide repeat protein [Candidatus Krumholzibacteria bacterium]|nr:tetratricopeptide repeat protein [Candidatus Krumholzibacteria bacterium]HPD72799.1 tetratricopeptide repeat protein [Candidatus Krumholzibacteria bacterium]HRY40269.1 tetratricopeptide repeat protein [Candidatus Krumholzibacteria bacterium]